MCGPVEGREKEEGPHMKKKDGPIGKER